MLLSAPMAIDPKTLGDVCKLLYAHKTEHDVGKLGEAVAILMTDADFVAVLRADASRPRAISSERDLVYLVARYVYFRMFVRDYASVALILWGPDVFSPEPKSVKLIWNSLFSNSLTAVMGASAQGKSYSAAAWHLIDWLLDPEWTRIEVLSTDSEHLKKNLWGDIQRLYAGASIALPGKADALSISISETAKLSGFGFFVVFAERGQESKGKLKGGHSRPRTGRAHDLFGLSSRRRIILDEAQEIPAATFDDIPNIVAGSSGVEHIKVFTAANPKDEFSRYGASCRPKGGWAMHDPLLETWISEQGWSVVRLNAMLSENVSQKRVVFPRMQTYEGVQRAIQNSGGDQNSPAVWTYVMGMFPPQGTSATIIKKAHIEAHRGEVSFTSPVVSLSALDPAFTGDRIAQAFGRAGQANGYFDYENVFHPFKSPRWCIQVDTVTILPPGDTQDVVRESLTRCRAANVKANYYGIDKTGTGIGVYDISCRQWNGFFGIKPRGESAPILGVSYAAKASETPISAEDSTPPSMLYTNTATELWYATAKLTEFGVVFYGRGIPTEALDELTARRGGTAPGLGTKVAVESKKIYKARGNKSPDLADAITILIHVGRQRVDEVVAKSEATPPEPSQSLPQWVTHAFTGWAESFAPQDTGLDTLTD